MATEAAATGNASPPPRLRLPERIPDLRTPWLILFELLWFAALLLAVAGPVIGTWFRLASPDEISARMPGGRAGLALSEDDLTHVRFPVGPEARAAGVRLGDQSVAI